MCVEGPPAESCVRLAKHYIENWKPISELLDATPVSVNLPVCLLSTWTVVLISATAAACYLSSAFHIGCKRKTNWKRYFWVVFFLRGCLYSSYLGFQKKKKLIFFLSQGKYSRLHFIGGICSREKKKIAEVGNFVGDNNFGRQSNFCWNWKQEK